MQIVHFTAPQLARMLGVNESTVKRWIDRGLLNSVRTPGGHRRIRESDLQAFLASQDKARKHSYVLARRHKEVTTEPWRKYYELHYGRNPHKAREYLTASFIALGSVRQVITTIIAPMLVEVGEAWNRGEIDIADEHRMTFLVRSDLLTLSTLLPSPKRGAPRALFACVPEDNHELALVLLSLVAQEAGWNTTVLGINVPAQQIEVECAASTIDFVVLTKIFSGAADIGYVRSVRALPHVRSVPIVVGGSGWSDADKETMQRMKQITFADSLDAFVHTLVKHAPSPTVRRAPRTKRS
jgi:MerR family transcriptional regulator, light-induced transcriptional regulator